MPRYTNKQIADALRRNMGMMYVAAQRLGCSYNTVARRVKQSAELTRIREESMGQLLDTAEARLFAAVNAGDPWAIQFVLKTKGRSRGYVERVDHRLEIAVHQEAMRIAEEQNLDVDDVIREAERIMSGGF